MSESAPESLVLKAQLAYWLQSLWKSLLLSLYAQREKAWTQSGVNDWKHLSEKVKRHVKYSCHVENCLKLAFFGKTNIAEQLSKAYRDSIIQHNLEVKKNPPYSVQNYLLHQILWCI